MDRNATFHVAPHAPQREIDRLDVASMARRDRFFERVHADLDIDTTAYAIVNDGRLLLRCDRVALLESRPGACRLLAVSGVDQMDRRGYVGRTLEELSRCVASTNEPIYYSGDSSQFPPQLQLALEQYVNQSHVRRLAVVPLTAPSTGAVGRVTESVSKTEVDDLAKNDEVLGVVVVENFSGGTEDERLWADVADLCPQISLALRNALIHSRMPLAPLSRTLQSASRFVRRPKAIILCLALAALFGILFCCKMDHEIGAVGSLQPKYRRDVFATADGIVQSILVKHGDSVAAGDVLVELSSADLEMEMSRLVGELKTAQQRLQTAKAQQWIRVDTSHSSAREGELAARQQLLSQQIKGLEAQLELLNEQQRRLVLRAPITGRVITWDTAQLLANRPVQIGQRLLTVVDDQSPTWRLELDVRDRDAGQMLLAQQRLQPDLPVSFLLATNPSISYHGRIGRVAIANHMASSGEATLQVNVDIEREGLRDARTGAEVLARIHCGRRTIAYVWSHQLINAVRRHVF